MLRSRCSPAPTTPAAPSVAFGSGLIAARGLHGSQVGPVIDDTAFRVAATIWRHDDLRDPRRVFEEKVGAVMSWNRPMGNSYTASLWFSVAEALAGRREGERITAFSYGSGFGAELFELTAGPKAADCRR